MIYLEEVLSKVFADSTTRATKANTSIILTCREEYFLPLYICYQKNVKLPSFDVMFNDTHTFFKDLSINYVAQTDDRSVAGIQNAVATPAIVACTPELRSRYHITRPAIT